MLTRRSFLTAAAASVAACATRRGHAASPRRTNVILCMADDQGWGDVGFRDHPILKTPQLDRMAEEGVRFDRFYAAAPCCSPTRASCLTGRHPNRMGIFNANKGHLPEQEIHLAQILKAEGYATGHFGKWHLGTLTKTVLDSNRGGKPEHAKHYAPPWDRDFDVCFSTEAKVPTVDPMVDPEGGGAYGTRYWTGPGEIVDTNLDGDDSRVIMDRAIPFIREAAENETPFFAVIWFHAPHKPLVDTPEYDAQYGEGSEYYGCISAIDTQVGRLRRELDALGISDDTMLWYTSDNGPEDRTPGATGPFRERKRSLHDGGVRVPGMCVWPRRFPSPKVVDAPVGTIDYLPTICAGLNVEPPERLLDGMNILPLMDDVTLRRNKPMEFEYRDVLALQDDRYKIIRKADGDPWALYDMERDLSEEQNLATDHPEMVKNMANHLLAWRDSLSASRNGADY